MRIVMLSAAIAVGLCVSAYSEAPDLKEETTLPDYAHGAPTERVSEDECAQAQSVCCATLCGMQV